MFRDFPKKKILRRMGYLSDQKGIMNRYLEEAEQWESHLRNTTEFVRESLAAAKPSHAVILGSGWLLDLPPEEILAYCGKVSLVDINHPPQILHQLRKYPAIIPVKADITGGLIRRSYEMAEECRRSGKLFDPDALEVPVPSAGDGHDFIISLNVLDQLDGLIVDYLLRFFNMPEGPVMRFRERIQQAHIGMVSSRSCCIIADEKEIVTDKNDREVAATDLLLADLPGGDHVEGWIWKFDNHFHYHKGYRTWFKVVAMSC